MTENISEKPTYAQILKGEKIPESKPDNNHREPTDKSRIPESPSYMQIFRDFFLHRDKAPTIEQIVGLIPSHATGENIYYKVGKEPQPTIGFRYEWRDNLMPNPELLRKETLSRQRKKVYKRKWRVYIRNPNPGAPEDSHTRNRWVVRIWVEETCIADSSNEYESYYMDSTGTFYHSSQALPNAHNADKRILEATHIPIQTPESYRSPIDNPNYYGRQAHTTLHSEKQSSSGPASEVDHRIIESPNASRHGPLPDESPDEQAAVILIGDIPICVPSLPLLKRDLSSGKRIGIHLMPSEVTSDPLERDQKATTSHSTKPRIMTENISAKPTYVQIVKGEKIPESKPDNNHGEPTDKSRIPESYSF